MIIYKWNIKLQCGEAVKVVFHENFYQIYASDPAAAAGRIEAVVDEISSRLEFIDADCI